MTASSLLKRAAELLDVYDWGQGEYVTRCEGEKPCLCALGALRLATLGGELADDDDLINHGNTRFRGWTLAEAEILLERAIGSYSIPEWNDQPERTKDEVKTMLLSAAEREL